MLVFSLLKQNVRCDREKTRFRCFTFPKNEKLGRIWENRLAARKWGKDGFPITEATVVYHVHFRADDILCVPGESR